MINQYSIFQKPLLAVHYCSNLSNVSFIIEVEGELKPKFIHKFCKLLIQIMPEIKCKYLPSQIIPLNINATEFIENKIFQVNNANDNEILLKNHNTRLNIETGETFKIVLNIKEHKSSVIFTMSHIIIDGISSLMFCMLFYLMYKRKYLKLFLFKLLLKKEQKNKKTLLKLTKYKFDGFNPLNSYPTDQKFLFSQHKALSILFEFDKPDKQQKYDSRTFTTAALKSLAQVCPHEEVVNVKRVLNFRGKIPSITPLALGNFIGWQRFAYNLSDFVSNDQDNKINNKNFNAVNVDTIVNGILQSENSNIDKFCHEAFSSKNISLAVSSLNFDKFWHEAFSPKDRNVAMTSLTADWKYINDFDIKGLGTIVPINQHNHSLVFEICPLNNTLKIFYLCDPNISNSTFTMNFLTNLFKNLGFNFNTEELNSKILEHYAIIENINTLK